MKLLDRKGFRTDDFARPVDGELTGIHCVLVPLATLPDALRLREYGQCIGVEISNTTDIAELAPYLDRLSLIAIAFPAFADGRGFSIARRLRLAGYAERLRAVGPLIADQFAYALACGFDEIELPDASAARQPEAQWQRAANVNLTAYQRGFNHDASILDRRRAQRAGASHA